MTTLTIDLFAAASDAEAAQYRILAGLRDAQHAFSRNRVYPHLADLIRVRRGLRALLDGLDEYNELRPGRLSGIDWEAGTLLYDAEEEDPPLLASDLAQWAMPLLTEAIEEGRTLFEFVDGRSGLEAVGLIPSYQAEGYLLVPQDGGGLGTLRYRVSVLADSHGRYRSLRTTPVPVALSPLAPPQAWKQALIDAHPDLPNPATYRLAADVQFPVEETMLPIAKRKLLRLVTDHGLA